MSKATLKAQAMANRTIGKYIANWNGCDETDELIDDEYEMFCESIESFENRNKSGYWKVEVENFGWNKRSGYMYVNAESMVELINRSLPDTENTFNVFHYKNGYAIQNYHHDSCTGKEFYYMVPCSESTYYRMRG